MKRFIIILLVSLLLLTAYSCRTRKLSSTQYLRDTVYVNHNSVQRDSVFVLKHDSVIVRMSGDTVFIDRFHTNFKDRILTKTDTSIKYQEHVAYKDVVREKLVEKKLSWWQNVLIWFGFVALMALLVLIVLYSISKSWKKL